MGIRKKVTIAVCVFFLCLFSTLLVATILITRPSVQKKILKKISEKSGYSIQVKDIKISLLHGIGISIKMASFKSFDNSIIFSCPKISIYYILSRLIKGSWVPESIILEKPEMIISVKRKKTKASLNKNILLLASSLSSFQIRDGRISINNPKLGISNLYLKLKKRASDKIYLSIRSNILLKKHAFPLLAKGIIDTSKGINAELDTEVKEFPLELVKIASVSFVKGIANVRIKSDITSNGTIKSSGNLKLKDMDFILKGRNKQKKRYRFAIMDIGFDGDYYKKTVRFNRFDIKAKDFKLNGNLKINMNFASPFISLNVQSPSMEIKTFKKIFPSCFLPCWLEKRLFPIIKDGRVKKIRFSLNGAADQISNIDKAENRSVLYGSLIMDNLSLWPKGGSQLMHIKGRVFLKDGNLLIKDVKADFASSLIKNADIIIKDVYQDNPGYYINLKGLFRLEDLIAQKKMEFAPEGIVKKIKDIKKVSGWIETDLKCKYRSAYNLPVFNNSSFILKNCYLLYKGFALPVYIRKARFLIDPDGNYRLSGNGMLGRSKLKILFESDPLLKILRINISGNVYPSEILSLYTKDLKINSLARLNMDAALYSSDSKLKIKRLLFKSKTSSFFTTGTYDIKNKDIYLRFRIDELNLKDLGIGYRDFKLKRGRIISQLKIRFSIKKPSSSLIYGTFRTEGLSIEKEGKKLVDKVNCRIQLSGNRVFIASLDGNIGTHPLHVKGNIKGWDRIKGNLDIKIDQINLAKLSLGAKKGDSKDFLKKIELGISVLVSKGICKNILFKPIKAKVKIEKGDIYIQQLTAFLTSGMISIKGHIKKPEIWIDSQVKLKDMPLEDIFSCIGVKKYLDGKINMKAHLYTRAKGIDQIFSNLNGEAKLSLKDGNIYKAQPVLKILDFFSISNIWKFNPASFFKNGVPFDVIKIKAKIKNGVISSDKMFMKSKALDAAAKGKLDLVKKRINMRIGIHPLNTVSSIIGKLPIVGYILAGKDKKITLYYFEIKGPLKNVKIEQRLLKNLLNGTFGIFKRILLTPSHIFEDIEDMGG